MQEALKREVRDRAGGRCEYCMMPQAYYRTPFQIDHVIARQHRGATHSDNLALACFHCNAHKGPNLSGIDPATSAVTVLFHPRKDRWSDHFAWNGPEVVGLTPRGRATVLVLN